MTRAEHEADDAPIDEADDGLLGGEERRVQSR